MPRGLISEEIAKRRHIVRSVQHEEEVTKGTIILRSRRAQEKHKHDATAPALRSFWSGAVEAAQFRQTMASKLWPKTGPLPNLIPALYTERNYAINHALDALALTHVGSQVQNQDLLQRGCRLYGLAVHKLHQELGKAIEHDRYSDQTLATPYVLFVCERYSSITTGSQIPLAHLKGSAHLLTARAMASGGTTPSLLQMSLLDEYHHLALEFGMSARRYVASMFNEETFRGQGTSSLNMIPLLLEALMRVPAMLEQCDTALALLGGKSAVKRHAGLLRAEHLIEQMDNLVALLQSRLDACQEGSPDAPFSQVPASSLPTFDADLDDLCIDAFGTVILFKDNNLGGIHFGVWTGSFLILRSVSKLRTAARKPPDHQVDYAELINGQADNVARSLIYWCAIPECGDIMVAAVGTTISLLQPWYLQTGDKAKIAWGQAVQRFVERKGYTCSHGRTKEDD